MIAVMLGHALIASEDAKNFAEAKQVLKNAVNRDNDNPFAWYQLGIVYDREGDMPAPRWRPPSATICRAITSSLWPAPRMAMAGLPAGTPDYLRAQDIAMVSEERAEEGQEKAVSESE